MEKLSHNSRKIYAIIILSTIFLNISLTSSFNTDYNIDFNQKFFLGNTDLKIVDILKESSEIPYYESDDKNSKYGNFIRMLTLT